MKKFYALLFFLTLVFVIAACGQVRYNEAVLLEGQVSESKQRTTSSRMSPKRLFARQKSMHATMPTPEAELNREEYAHIQENEFQDSKLSPLSTFSIDVDTASYSNVRRQLTMGKKPVRGSIRIEELINYFPYHYAGPRGQQPIALHTELTQAPWNPKHHLLKIGIQAKKVNFHQKQASNLVFLLDVSGSMGYGNKLPLVKKSLKMLLESLKKSDKVAIVVYAGASGVALPSTSAAKQVQIIKSLDKLETGGSTYGGAGIKLAYRIAKQNFIPGGINRVILATDGDFNVGQTSESELTDLIKKQAKSGVYLTVLGFGMGNYQDKTLELLSANGNGNYAYIDNLMEAKKVLVKEIGGTLITLAKDVKIQVEFNPEVVAAYRLIGYENRKLASRDFNDDKKDAGEIGSGHSVTALYEVIPAGLPVPQMGSVDPLKYQKSEKSSAKKSGTASKEIATVKVRYKPLKSNKSKLIQIAVRNKVTPFAKASRDLRFASNVATFGMLLRGSKFKGEADYPKLMEQLEDASLLTDEYRLEFKSLVKKAWSLQ